MKQKITVRAYIKQEGKILLIRRATGNEHLRGKLELPGGKLEYGEQPVDVLRRALQHKLDVAPETVQLYDVVSYAGGPNKTIHHVAIVFLASLAPHTRTITLSPAHDKYVWKKMSELQLDEVTESARLVLGLSSSVIVTEKSNENKYRNDDIKSSMSNVVIYSDGGSRGNPGPSAAGFVVMDAQETVLFEGGKYLGITTNNQAEYQAVCMGLQKAKEMGARTVDCRIDSLLVVNQLSGIYQIKNKELWPVHSRIKDLASSFEKVTFRHVKREFNKLADGMVNKVLDEQKDSIK